MSEPLRSAPMLPLAAARNGPFAALLGWVLGNAAQLTQAALGPAWAYGLVAAAALLGGIALWRTRRPWGVLQRRLAWCLLAAALGWGLTGLRGVAFAAGALAPALEGQDVQVIGVVSELPQRNEAGLRFTLATESASQDGRPVTVPALLDVGWYGHASADTEPLDGSAAPGEVQAGERWRLPLRLKAPHGSRNPWGFDYELWLWERGVQATAYVRAAATPPERLAQTGTHPVAWLRQVVRARIQAQVQPPAVAGLLAALVVGDQAAIDRADWDVFRATGVAHLVSISGLHITMFAWGAAALVGWAWRRSPRLCLACAAPTAALLGGVLLASAYALFSGWGIPAQRTCLMLASVALLRLTGARWPWPQTWMLACALVVASDPWALLQAGFWLSFVAVGVLFASAAGAARPAATPPASLVQRGRRHALALWREQWVVTLALAPLTLLLFGQVSLVGLLANAVAIPWITLLVTPLALAGVLWAPLWSLAAAASGVLMALLQGLAGLPWATLSWATPPAWLAAAAVLGGVLLVARLPWSLRALGLPLLLPVLLWRAPLPPEGAFALLAADIGQGNAVLVRTAHHALLYDAGPRYSQDSDAGHRVLLPLLQALQVRLDLLVLSHRDTDHVGGAPAVLAMQPQAGLLSSIAADDHLQALRPATRCVAGQHWEWDGVQFEVLHPQPGDYAMGLKPNALSCVLRIASGGATPRVALLVGDLERPQEEALVAAGAPLRADVLLVPHHGSKTSSSPAFLDAVQPQAAWVQAGYRNRYGHPAEAVLQRYQERHIPVHDSPHCGAMAWQSEQPTQVICTRTEAMHYWSHRVP